jgi:glycerate kinase
MNILIAPDKFKYSLTAKEVCEAVEKGIRKYMPSANIIKIPLADGGEGSLETLENTIKFERVYLKVKNPVFKSIKTFYGILKDTAYIEMSSVSGLQLLDKSERNPMRTTSFGTGELILDAINKGVNKIYLFVGGSATNDAAIGIASALGYVFKDENNKTLDPVGSNLIKIKSIYAGKAESLTNIDFHVLTDVNNPFFGCNGAARIFASQKGANSDEITILDDGLKNISEIFKSKFGIDVSDIPGSGAAGGVGGGAMVFCSAKIKSGIDTILDLLNIDNVINESDLVITGEGFLDKQTFDGKVVMGVINRCNLNKKPLGIVCGDTSLTEYDLLNIYPSILKPIKMEGISIEDSMQNASTHLIKRAQELIKEFCES